jgi:hypothetical protein
MAKSINKQALLDLLKDDEVRAQVEALLMEILGKDKGALIMLLLEQLQANTSEVETPVEKKPWWKKLFSWVTVLLPYIVKLFGKKK